MLLPDGRQSGSFTTFFLSLSLSFSHDVNDAPTDSRADVVTAARGMDLGSQLRSPLEQMVVIDRLVAACVATASDPLVETTASLSSRSSSNR